ncbi:PA2778 family cysteine peptidase [Denitromonas halophila]|uniref:PA2778 family cysteine peptidase n=1 Tax=Denitromonas halophila TaxID=1629404 RepID=UPI001FE5ED2A|nr:PA2778 family cysteine peptidase [Denitromonas halophila]
MRVTHHGNPVVVFQNLGLSWTPSWHYAVVIGYDLDAAHLVLRSGPMKRQELAFSTFEHTWERGGRWAFVVTPPGSLPATASESEATRALVAFEHNAPPNAAARAYQQALARWPDNLTLAMGLGNTLYAQGEKPVPRRCSTTRRSATRMPPPTTTSPWCCLNWAAATKPVARRSGRSALAARFTHKRPIRSGGSANEIEASSLV